jgi:putative tryptophan/tyrosine transport system substrate-binding protein
LRMKTLFKNTCNLTSKTLLIAAALAVRLFLAPLPAAAADVLIIKDSDIKPFQEAIQGFKQSCGCTVREMNLSDLEAIEKAIKAKPDAIVSVGSRTFRKIKTIRNMPVIYMMVMPSETADALGENVSGVSMDIAPSAYLTIMTGLFPGAKRIGLLFDPENTGRFVREASAAAHEKGISLITKTVREPREAPALLDELRDKVDLLWMLPDAALMNSETIDHLLLFSFQNSVPVFTFSKKFTEMGACAALTISPEGMGKQAGEIARSLFQGAKGPLRAYASGPHLIVNTKVGAKLGVRINDELVQHAEKVE